LCFQLSRKVWAAGRAEVGSGQAVYTGTSQRVDRAAKAVLALDNFEQVMGAATDVAALLDAASAHGAGGDEPRGAAPVG